MENYHQITGEERYVISHLRKQGFTNSQIARQTGRHRSSIAREIARNKRKDGGYPPCRAQQMARARRSRSRKKSQYTSTQMDMVCQYIYQQWSPEQVAGYLKREGLLKISHETIYRYIWRDKAEEGGLYLNLRGARKQRRKRYGVYDSRGRIAEKPHISQRLAAVETRQELGHWEADTVMGARGDTHCILTLVERKTGYTLIGKLPNRIKEALTNKLVQLVKRHPEAFKTITADNGTEFHGYRDIQQRVPVDFYFATPYHS